MRYVFIWDKVEYNFVFCFFKCYNFPHCFPVMEAILFYFIFMFSVFVLFCTQINAHAESMQVKYLMPPCHDPFRFDLFCITYTAGSQHSLVCLGITGWSNVIMENYKLSFHLSSDTFSLQESISEELLCFFNSWYFLVHSSFI